MSSPIILCSADYTSNFFDSPEFFLTVLRLVGFLALPVHIFGGYCILFKTPKEMISVEWTLLNLHLTSCFSDWSLSFLGTLYFFVPLMGASPLGILTRVGMGMPEISYLLEVAIASVAASVVVILENRFYILSSKNLWWHRFRFPFLVFTYLTVFTFFYPIYIDMPAGSDNKRDFILQTLPCLSDRMRELPLYLVVEDRWQFIKWTGSESIFLCTCLIILFVSIKWSLKQYGRNLSKKTLDLQKKLIRAIILQLAIPFSVIIIPTSYYSHFPYFIGSMNNIMFIIISNHGFVSTIVMLIVQKPYRDYLLKLLGVGGRGLKRRMGPPSVSLNIVQNNRML
ncbi:hypothetical protein GCK72_019594 [Caenorhabditis remanei]|uniref:Serpentine Receptor, class H n=1 Tax=Caenorhabditis remanei TaxID=31234 RepID=A0A6A5GD17_CAERE|nr:hypothetical protein GCK72_019594 [Caenorhabditis remanei]KAF1753038.1 hypothetical protein GCK72_019594 [Caenorhabditis remanei]